MGDAADRERNDPSIAPLDRHRPFPILSPTDKDVLIQNEKPRQAQVWRILNSSRIQVGVLMKLPRQLANVELPKV